MKMVKWLVGLVVCTMLMPTSSVKAEVFVFKEDVSSPAMNEFHRGYKPLYQQPDRASSRHQILRTGNTTTIDAETFAEITRLTVQLGDPTAFRQRISLFEFASRGTNAARALAGFGMLARDQVMRALRGTQPTARGNAALALGYLKDAAAVKPLTLLVHDACPIVRTKAVMALGEIGAAGAVPMLIQALADEDLVVRMEAVRALSNIQGRRAVDALIRVMGDESCLVSTEAIMALVKKAEDDYVVTSLVSAMNNSNNNPLVRTCAAKALAYMQQSEAIDALVNAWINDANASRNN